MPDVLDVLRSQRAEHLRKASALEKAITALTGTGPAKKGKSKMSAATRKKLSTAQKARWAKKRAEAK